MDRLPQDVLAGVLARLPPRGLAVSRCVCREWRAVADARCHLRAGLLPISPGGFFVSLYEPAPPEFFARPSAAHRVAGRLESYVDMEHHADIPDIINCCNGLLLLDWRVVNPATRQWARLPPYPASHEGSERIRFYNPHLAFDPMLSPHYQVLSMQHPFDCKERLSDESEWPPPKYKMLVYSSETGRWEERPFVREGGPAETKAVQPICGHAVYWHEALYVHCTTDFIMRITMSDDKYQIIKLPSGIDSDVYLGKSKNGVHFASVDYQSRLQVWLLDESDGKRWILKHGTNLQAVVSHFLKNSDDQTDRPWILQGGNYDQEHIKGPITEQNLDWGWDFDDDNAIDVEDWDEKCSYGLPRIFGFHPYKEIIFLHLSSTRVVAYHFNSSKVQDLGELCMEYRIDTIKTAFVYTPCWIGELSGNKSFRELV